MPGLTAKVFRTYNASYTFQQELEKTPAGADTSVAEKILAYNRANREVAVLCNHQRSVPKAHGTQMDRMDTRIRVLKYERMLVKKAILANDPKLKKTRPELVLAESDLEEDGDGDDEGDGAGLMEQTVESMKQADLDKLKKKTERSNEKIRAGEAEGEIVGEAELEKMLKEHAKTCGAVALQERVDKMNEERYVQRESADTPSFSLARALSLCFFLSVAHALSPCPSL